MAWGLVSYLLWGVFPLFWRLLSDRPALETLAHRMVWSFAFYLLIFLGLSYRRILTLFQQSSRDWLLSGIAAVLLTVNWGIYIHAVNTGHVLEGSLAYFINPILNVVVGVFLFKEPITWVLRLSVLSAALGVGLKVAFSPHFPWIALTLATLFCAYGATKKTLKIPARTSSVLEGAVGFIPALLAVVYFRANDRVALSLSTWLLLAAGGVVTGLPLFLFSYAAQRVPYSLLGLLQFVAPSLQFLVAVVIFHEPLGPQDWAAFGLIWVGVLFYACNQLWQRA